MKELEIVQRVTFLQQRYRKNLFRTLFPQPWPLQALFLLVWTMWIRWGLPHSCLQCKDENEDDFNCFPTLCKILVCSTCLYKGSNTCAPMSSFSWLGIDYFPSIGAFTVLFAWTTEIRCYSFVYSLSHIYLPNSSTVFSIIENSIIIIIVEYYWQD